MIFQDNDDVGKAYAQEIAAALHGVAASVRVVDLSCIWSEIPEHGDISDLIDRFGDEKVCELIAQLVQSTPEWAPGIDIRPADYSDAANADVFAAVHANDLIYTDALGWLWWNGKRWERDDHKRAELVADAVLSDLYKPEYVPMELVEKIAYAPRVKRWKELGIMPGGAKSEVFKGVVKCSTNLNSDPVDMLTDCLRLGISTGVYGLTLTNLLNDVLLGEPELRQAPVGLRVIDPDYINIMITGHQHTIFVDLQEKLISPEAVAKAKAAGTILFLSVTVDIFKRIIKLLSALQHKSSVSDYVCP